MTQHTLVAVSLITRSPAFDAPPLTVVRAQNLLVTEFQRGVVSQLGRAVVQVPQALLLIVAGWLIRRFMDH